MIKTMLVEDDYIFLMGLKEMIDWNSNGYELISVSTNGIDALANIEDMVPDLIITDVDMPKMNGIDLIRTAKTANSNIKSLILTCHQDFNYAKEAIDLQVDGFLIKHTLTADELLGKLRELRITIESEKKVSARINSVLTGRQLIVDKFFRELCNGLYHSDAEVIMKGERFDIDLPKKGYLMSSFFVENNIDCSSDLLNFSVRNIVEEIMGDRLYQMFSVSEGNYHLIYWSDTKEEDVFGRLGYLSKYIVNEIRKCLSIDLRCCGPIESESLISLTNTIDETLSLRDAYFYSPNLIYVNKPISFSDVNNIDIYQENHIKILDYLHPGAKLGVALESAEKMFKSIETCNLAPQEARRILSKYIIDIESIANRNGITIEHEEIIESTFDYYKALIYQKLIEFFDGVDSRRDRHIRDEVSSVVSYVKSNLDEDISCEKMAELVNMNRSYFSRMFKKEMGISFSDFLSQQRMERARMLLLSTELSVKEVAMKVGIYNEPYFYRIFKKYQNVTPGKLRNG